MISHTVEQYKIVMSIGAILHNANSMWDSMQTLKADYPMLRTCTEELWHS